MGVSTNVLLMILIVYLTSRNKGSTDFVFSMILVLRGSYTTTYSALKEYNGQLDIISEKLKSCETVTTFDGSAIGFKYITDECKLLVDDKFNLGKKISSLERWLEMPPMKQYYIGNERL
jgi:hypothetical protein